MKRKTTPGRRFFTCVFASGRTPNAANPTCLFLVRRVAAHARKGNL